MTDLPASLTYLGSLQGIGQILKRSALPLIEADQLNDPFLPDRNTPIPFSAEKLFESAVKYISHGILGKNAPRGQPNHPLQKAIVRWRMEDRFSNEVEIKEALQGLLPAMVEKAYSEARQRHQDWIDYVSSRKVVPLFEKFQDLTLWETRGMNHKGAAIKFKCSDDSIFKDCSAVRYDKIPASTVSLKSYVEYMVGVITEIAFEPRNLLLTQNYDRRQHKEWRLILEHDQMTEQWLAFPTTAIQGVYVGALVPDNTVEQLKSMLTRINPAISLFRARCKATEFSLEMEKINENESEVDEAVVE